MTAKQVAQSYSRYQDYKAQVSRVAGLAKRAQASLAGLNFQEEENEAMRLLSEHLDSDVFRVLVMGEFKAGKSTLINALLRSPVLPSFVTPTTAIICEVQWGESRKIILHKMAEDEPPFEIGADELEKYVVIPEDELDADAALQSQLKKAIVYWPIELCRNGVQIADSPGLNEAPAREKITLGYISRADAVIFVVSSERVGPADSEAQTIRLLYDHGHKDIFFVFNRFDLIREKDRERLSRFVVRNFSGLTARGEQGLFFVSASDALEGYTLPSPELVARSQLPPLESALEDFLVNERGNVKIKRVTNQMKLMLDKGLAKIREERAAYRQSTEKLKASYDSQQVALNQMEQRRETMKARADVFVEKTALLARESAEEFYLSLPGRIDDWLDKYVVQNPVKFFTFQLPQTQVRKLAEELAEYIRRRVDGATKTWEARALQPLLESQLNKLKQDLDQQANDFIAQADNVRAVILDQSSPDDSVQVGRNVPVWERILCAAGGLFVVGGIWAGGMGAIFGWEEMAKALLPTIGLFTLAVLLDLNPVFFLLATIVGALAQALFKIKGFNERIKDEVGKQLKHAVKERRSNNCDAVKKGIEAELVKVATALDTGLRNEIDDIRNLVLAALERLEQGQQEVDRRVHELDQLENTLQSLADGLLSDGGLPQLVTR